MTANDDYPSSLALLPGIVDRPYQTFTTILESPRLRWVLPAILCIMAAIIFVVVAAPYLSEQAIQQQEIGLQQVEQQMGDMTESQREQMRQQMATFSDPLVVGGLTLLTSILGLLIAWATGAAILYFGLAIGGQDLRFGQIFSAYSWAWLPFCLRDLVNAGWVLVTGEIISNPGLSYFVSTGDLIADAGNPLWILTSKLDLFFLWHVVLVFFLIRAARPRGSAIWLSIIYVILYLALRVLPGTLIAGLSFGG
ncbi:MAG: YIP1 family protein [Chloroflexota bacterium]|nr:YIP1 family protein [Chloroflexota bacterium]